jgi:hypothetical protein
MAVLSLPLNHQSSIPKSDSVRIDLSIAQVFASHHISHGIVAHLVLSLMPVSASHGLSGRCRVVPLAHHIIARFVSVQLCSDEHPCPHALCPYTVSAEISQDLMKHGQRSASHSMSHRIISRIASYHMSSCRSFCLKLRLIEPNAKQKELYH